jgi:hypothetical protein
MVCTELLRILYGSGVYRIWYADKGLCMEFTVCVVRRLVWYSVRGFGGWEGIAFPAEGFRLASLISLI